MFFSLSLLDCGALTWGTTGLSSLFISSSTLSAFCRTFGVREDARRQEEEQLNNHNKGTLWGDGQNRSACCPGTVSEPHT